MEKALQTKAKKLETFVKKSVLCVGYQSEGGKTMNEEKRQEIVNLRKQGMSMRKLAEYTGETIATIRAKCKGVSTSLENRDILDQIRRKEVCAYCGRRIEQPKMGRPRRFCSDDCRRAYWKANRDIMKRNPEAIYTKVCPYCGKTFQAYGNKNRKYCCHEHYVLDYYGDRKRA